MGKLDAGYKYDIALSAPKYFPTRMQESAVIKIEQSCVPDTEHVVFPVPT